MRFIILCFLLMNSSAIACDKCDNIIHYCDIKIFFLEREYRSEIEENQKSNFSEYLKGNLNAFKEMRSVFD